MPRPPSLLAQTLLLLSVPPLPPASALPAPHIQRLPAPTISPCLLDPVTAPHLAANLSLVRLFFMSVVNLIIRYTVNHARDLQGFCATGYLQQTCTRCSIKRSRPFAHLPLGAVNSLGSQGYCVFHFFIHNYLDAKYIHSTCSLPAFKAG